MEDKKVEVPEKFKKLVDEIEKMSVLDLSELVHVLEDKFGVSAAMPMMAAPAAGGADGAPAVAEQSVFAVELKDAGAQKIQVIKALREVTGLGLAEAKAMADAAPKVVKEGVAKAEAEELKKKLEDAGATVVLK
jgi:large subunit ribosomal protein L7/L12